MDIFEVDKRTKGYCCHLKRTRNGPSVSRYMAEEIMNKNHSNNPIQWQINVPKPHLTSTTKIMNGNYSLMAICYKVEVSKTKSTFLFCLLAWQVCSFGYMDLIQTTFYVLCFGQGTIYAYSLVKLICGDLFWSKSKGKRKIYTCTIVSSTKVQIGPNALALGLAKNWTLNFSQVSWEKKRMPVINVGISLLKNALPFAKEKLCRIRCPPHVQEFLCKCFISLT